ncbi:MAG: chromosomal replication initiator protein DnaA [Lentimicrobium sp.]|jgi:chromosomal replication initiator protein|nr:chromosomal replication initiator protein DnaA [Lentimicrobium sp.]MDD2526825.1 chromosomal replication initiator protein DnaA [Lentimicrobiaceae bacterium]MDD4598107.1 chromosomal replication initiator protein DnaA [Lentimicrobiaceae bacterium]MDY0024438.1 chromosomal replication initiator protein DnaA [Lentimicrobium sp.]HAH58194.1 chromosomal replication initiator protein DnaA [Bacteroidales bacterium]
MKKDYQEVWKNCLSIIKDNINSQSYKTWFSPIQPVKLSDNVLTIQVPSQFFYEWLEEHYIGLLKKTIKHELGAQGRLEYSIIMESASGNGGPYTVKVPTSNRSVLNNPSVSMPIDINKGGAKEIPNPFVIPGLKKIKVHSQLNESYSFENFIEGECNRLARSAGYAAANNPGKTSFNPIFIYSANGLGKTHLAHAIGIEVKNKFPDKTVLYVTTEQFLQQYVEASKNKNQNDFVHFYQMIDVLLIDDIQFLSGKEKTQEIFFHIFNHLHQNNNQLVITSDKAPAEIKGIEPRLLSRFKWGLAADLQVPDFDTRLAILKKRLYKDGIEMPEEVIEYLAFSITTNVRELEGALISLMAQSSLNKKAITIELARQMIDKFILNTSKEVSIDYIQKVVCDFFDIQLDHMNSKTRKREIVQARQLAMYFAKKHTKSSLATIGFHCGNKDHATVLHACRTVTNLIETDKEFRNYAEEIEKNIKI